MGTKNNLLHFFDRPAEPCFMKKQDSVFELPDHYYTDKYRPIKGQIESRFGDEGTRRIPIRNISIPNLDLPLRLKRNEQFSLFVPGHRKMAGKLIDIFMGMRDVEDLQSICAYTQLRMNPYLFNYCLSVAMLHRNDTRGLDIPSFVQSFPDKFVDPKVFPKARETAKVQDEGLREPIIVPQNYTAREDLEPEQRVAYFREDMGINLHHWHWHLVYPFQSENIDIVRKDRRGELFYYMHQQIIARYNTERLCNNLRIVSRFNNFKEPIAEGYFPKLDSIVASRSWPPRFENTRISDLNRPVDTINIDVVRLEEWRDRFVEACRQGAIQLPSGGTQRLDEETGIDILGNLMEASMLSANPDYYGDMHNMGHVFISYAHDPDHRNLEQFGVMGDSATAMRDPVFYRWHAYIDDLFQIHKATLPQYETSRLEFPSVTVSAVNIEPSAGGGGKNNLNTFWQQSDVNLERGLDFVPGGNVFARFTHLQHRDFTYVIDCVNASGSPQNGTVRIFMAPRMNDRGQPLPFDEQRLLMIELDKFTHPLTPGNNKIRRRSTESSVTIPFERTFRDQSQRQGDAGSAAAAEFDFCGCGWPQHMLIPKGTEQGFPMVLFAMVSNAAEDMVAQDMVGTCNDAASYCGVRDRRYPDRRSMGYPFDRKPRAGVTSLQTFLTPNMAIRDCTVRFTNNVELRPRS